MNATRFYNDLSDRLGLPRAATKDAWAEFGRVLAPTACHRFYEFGVPFYGIESTALAQEVPLEEAKEPLTLGAILREAMVRQQAAAQPDPNAAMIARDGPAKDKAQGVLIVAPVSTAKPAIASLTRSPDLAESRHQVSPRHALAAKG